MKRIWTAALILCASLAITVTGQQRSSQTQAAEAALGAAIHQEEAEGNLEAAIASYKRFLSQYGNIRPLAAKAQFRLAGAYEKLGSAETAKAYEQVTRQYADQREIAAEAGRRLAGLTTSKQTGAPSPRLIAAGKIAEGAWRISPDGRWLTMTDWDAESIAIHDMSTGQTRQLASSTGTDLQHVVLSPDLRLAVYQHYIEANDEAQVRIVDNAPGAKPRVLLRANSEDHYFEPAAWSPDGKSILVAIAKADKTWELSWVSASDGAVTRLKSLEWRISRIQRTPPRISPDGKYIAYSALARNPSRFPPAASDPADQHIYVIAADGSEEFELVRTAGINEGPVWSPDGARVFYTSNSSGSFDLWSVGLRDGRTELIRRNTGRIQPIGMTQAGSYQYVLRQSIDRVFTAAVQPDGKIQKAPADDKDAAIGFRSRWSPNGKSMAFIRHRPGNADSYDVVIRSRETGIEKTIARPGIEPWPPHWFHDNRSIAIAVRDGGRRQLYRVNVETGEFQQLPLPSNVPRPSWLLAISPDDKVLYAASSDPTSKLGRILGFDLETGRQITSIEMPRPQFSRDSGVYALALNPQGDTLAVWSPSRVAVIRTDGTGYRELYNYNDDATILWTQANTGELAWTPDGRSVLFFLGRGRLMRVSSEIGPAEFTGMESKALMRGGSIDISPDGSRVAYSETVGITELWALDNLFVNRSR